jgi:hypothetical protein
MKISDQALGAVMMALQKSLLEQTDIVPVLREFDFQVNKNEEIVVTNPPIFKFDGEDPIFDEETGEALEEEPAFDPETGEILENQEETKSTVGSD